MMKYPLQIKLLTTESAGDYQKRLIYQMNISTLTNNPMLAAKNPSTLKES